VTPAIWIIYGNPIPIIKIIYDSIVRNSGVDGGRIGNLTVPEIDAVTSIYNYIVVNFYITTNRVPGSNAFIGIHYPIGGNIAPSPVFVVGRVI
jgi:hypothetical protein